MDVSPQHRRLPRNLALILVAALAWLSVWSVTPPAPAGADAPADQFSAARAFAHIQRIGAQVHVAGSAAADDVRGYIVSTLRSYGLRPRIQDAVGADGALGHGFAMAHVRNVIAVLPGTASTGRVFAVAHYDSVQVSYGANDDGAGVVSLLETARALSQGPRPRNDTVFVFTDAEEACLCGAEAFVSQDELAASGGVALNFESRGSSGPSIMFETSANNAGVVAMYAQAVPYPVATSFAVEVYRILPNDTDFTLFRESGRFTGLNSAYIDGSATYHSPEDRPSYLDQSSLQQQGANALALTRTFAGADLAVAAQPSTSDVTYFPALGHLVRYPGALVWVLAVVALLAVVGLVVLGRRLRVASLGQSLAAFGLTLVPLLVAAVLAQLLWTLLVAIRPGYGPMLDPWQPQWYRAAVVALVATVLLTWYGLARRRLGGWALAIGGLGWLAVLGVVLAALTPGGSYLGAVPALAGAVAAIVALHLSSAWARALVLALGAAVSVIVLAPTVLLFFPALGLQTGGAAAFVAAMLGLAVMPLLDRLFPAGRAASSGAPVGLDWPAGPARPSRLLGALPALVALVVTVALVGVGLAVDRFDAVHPAPEHLMYALDQDTGQAHWVSIDTAAGSWSAQYLSGHEDLGREFPPLGGGDLLTGPAPVAPLSAPTVIVGSDVRAGGRRTISFTVHPQRGVRLVYVATGDAKVIRAVVDGRDVPESALADGFSVLFHAPPADGLPITLVLDGTGPVPVRVMDGSDGLDGLPGFHPRPAGIGVRGSHVAELALVARTATI